MEEFLRMAPNPLIGPEELLIRTDIQLCSTGKLVAKEPEGPLTSFSSQLQSAHLFNLASYLADPPHSTHSACRRFGYNP
ncbi:hypothetical protein FQN60_001418 [Etheostoma spectabile]|uniref:Uncharacterized protein n=1 Tax=Etheostoma spectabile TaxID=54343 RepID=A0A5J5D4C1_9PERO|nr:hypothetical protein FQN60_001418 [Etheostoma spectabile]